MREDRSSLISGKREFLQNTCSPRPTAKTPIHIQIDDQLPIANNEDIEINRLKLDGAEVDKATGRAQDLEVKPEVKRTFRYEVKSEELYVRLIDSSRSERRTWLGTLVRLPLAVVQINRPAMDERRRQIIGPHIEGVTF